MSLEGLTHEATSDGSRVELERTWLTPPQPAFRAIIQPSGRRALVEGYGSSFQAALADALDALREYRLEAAER